MKPDYDTTLARIAGNIAAGLVTTALYNKDLHGRLSAASLPGEDPADIQRDTIAAVAVDLAERVVTVCRYKHRVELAQDVELQRPEPVVR